MGKKIKKAVGKVTKSIGGVVGSKLYDENKKAKQVDAEEAAPPPAASVEAPKETANESDGADSEAARKAARARGKRGLSVARSSGTGLNI